MLLALSLSVKACFICFRVKGLFRSFGMEDNRRINLLAVKEAADKIIVQLPVPDTEERATFSLTVPHTAPGSTYSLTIQFAGSEPQRIKQICSRKETTITTRIVYKKGFLKTRIKSRNFVLECSSQFFLNTAITRLKISSMREISEEIRSIIQSLSLFFGVPKRNDNNDKDCI